MDDYDVKEPPPARSIPPRAPERRKTPPHTHAAWAFQRTGRKSGRLLECGSGVIDRDRNIAKIYMNRQPIGGYTGYVVLLPHGVQPEPPKDSEDDDESED